MFLEKELKVIAKDIKQKLLDKGLDKVDIDGSKKASNLCRCRSCYNVC